MRIALLTVDNREPNRDYHATVPYFGTAPEALLQGFATLPDLEVHVVTCTQKPMKSPEKLAPNLWFHSLNVPKVGWMRTSYQGCIRAIRRRLKVIQPELVHGQCRCRRLVVDADPRRAATPRAARSGSARSSSARSGAPPTRRGRPGPSAT